MRRMRQHCDSLERGNGLLQQLHALSDHIRDIDRDSRDVAAGVSQTRDEADLNRSVHDEKDDRYRCGCSLGGHRARRRSSQDDIYLQSHQILAELRKLVQAAVGRPEFPDEVSTFGVSSFSQTLLKCLEKGLGGMPLAPESGPTS